MRKRINYDQINTHNGEKYFRLHKKYKIGNKLYIKAIINKLESGKFASVSFIS